MEESLYSEGNRVFPTVWEHSLINQVESLHGVVQAAEAGRTAEAKTKMAEVEVNSGCSHSQRSRVPDKLVFGIELELYLVCFDIVIEQDVEFPTKCVRFSRDSPGILF